jgi:hypothetical protein
MKMGFDGQKHMALRSELQMIQMMIQSQTDCRTTFAAASIDPLAPGEPLCGSTTDGIHTAETIDLRTRTGGVIVPKDGELNGWKIRAACSKAEGTIVVRAAKLNAGKAVVDPLDQKSMDWSAKSGIVFGSIPGSPPTVVQLCSSSFSGTTTTGTYTCAADEVLSGVDVATGTATCVAAQKPLKGSCGSNQVLTGFSPAGAPLCEDVQKPLSSACSGDTVLTGFSASGAPVCSKFQRPLASNCAAGQVLQGFTVSGAPICVAEQKPLAGDCPAGQTLTGFGADGSARCTVVQKPLTTGCAGSQSLAGFTSNGSPICIAAQAPLNSWCPGNTNLAGFDVAGTPVCTAVQRPLNAACPANTSSYYVDGNGINYCREYQPPLRGQAVHCPTGTLTRQVGYDGAGNLSVYCQPSHAIYGCVFYQADGLPEYGVWQDGCPGGWAPAVLVGYAGL